MPFTTYRYFLMCSIFAGSLSVAFEASAGSVEITKTPDGQKVITRNGKSTDISIQSNGSSKTIDDDFEDIEERVSSSHGTSKKRDVPSEEEFKERVRSRMRSVSP
jgi:hypothetical protein